MNSGELTPPDKDRCQAHVPTVGPFQMGGPPGDPDDGYRRRCDNKSEFIVTETNPGEDGQCGAMALCADCFWVFKQKGLWTERIKVEKLCPSEEGDAKLKVNDLGEHCRTEDGRPDFAGFAEALRAEAHGTANIHAADVTGQAASDIRTLQDLADQVEAIGDSLGYCSRERKPA